MATLIERFWTKVDRRGADECWPWLGALAPGGYGMIRLGGKGSGTSTAHRVACEIAHGPLADGQVACHRCDNRWCVNPAHIFPGSQADNIRDMVGKRRHVRGEAHRVSKLTSVAVAEIRARHAAGGVTFRALGREYGVDSTWVSHIVNGRWRRDG